MQPRASGPLASSASQPVMRPSSAPLMGSSHHPSLTRALSASKQRTPSILSQPIEPVGIIQLPLPAQDAVALMKGRLSTMGVASIACYKPVSMPGSAHAMSQRARAALRGAAAARAARGATRSQLCVPEFIQAPQPLFTPSKQIIHDIPIAGTRFQTPQTATLLKRQQKRLKQMQAYYSSEERNAHAPPSPTRAKTSDSLQRTRPGSAGYGPERRPSSLIREASMAHNVTATASKGTLASPPASISESVSEWGSHPTSPPRGSICPPHTISPLHSIASPAKGSTPIIASPAASPPRSPSPGAWSPSQAMLAPQASDGDIVCTERGSHVGRCCAVSSLSSPSHALLPAHRPPRTNPAAAPRLEQRVPSQRRSDTVFAAAAPSRLHQVALLRPQPLAESDFKAWVSQAMEWGEVRDVNVRKGERLAAQALFEPLAMPIDLDATQLPPPAPLPRNAFRA